MGRVQMGDAGRSNYATTEVDASRPVGTQENPQPVTTEFVNGRSPNEVNGIQHSPLACAAACVLPFSTRKRTHVCTHARLHARRASLYHLKSPSIWNCAAHTSVCLQFTANLKQKR